MSTQSIFFFYLHIQLFLYSFYLLQCVVYLSKGKTNPENKKNILLKYCYRWIMFWSLCCLFFLDIRILITPLVSSNSSYLELVKVNSSDYLNQQVWFICSIFRLNISQIPQKYSDILKCPKYLRNTQIQRSPSWKVIRLTKPDFRCTKNITKLSPYRKAIPLIRPLLHCRRSGFR